jgi:bifunctional DNA-binding transcriptional regulator/antitoxin component of YhaV-PrlF toxin-antitoxin module
MSLYRTEVLEDGSIEVPAEILERLGIEVGDDVYFFEEGDSIVISKERVASTHIDSQIGLDLK